jgi:hypothetical protein
MRESHPGARSDPKLPVTFISGFSYSQNRASNFAQFAMITSRRGVGQDDVRAFANEDRQQPTGDYVPTLTKSSFETSPIL